MTALSRIIVPLDGSELAEAALPLAGSLAARLGATLELVHVHGVRYGGGDDAAEERAVASAREYVERVASGLGEPGGAATEVMLLEGVVAREIADRCTAHDGSLVVMTTHGRSGLSRAWLGSTADTLARLSVCPVLLVRPTDGGDAPTGGLSRILVAVDGSDRSEAVLPTVRALAEAHDARVRVLRVVDSDEAVAGAERELEALTARGGLQGAETTVLAGGSAAPAILERAREDGADLIALSPRGRGGVARMILGSVADKVVRGAEVPVLLHGGGDAD